MTTEIKRGKVINNLRDLEQFGINLLTGEADAYCMRLLCDLSQKGVELVTTYYGLPPTTVFAANWNSKVGDDPAIASMMLSHQSLLEIGKFALFHIDGFEFVVEQNGCLTAANSDSKLIQFYLEEVGKMQGNVPYKLWRNCAMNSNQPRQGDRNIHAATGRAV